MKKLFAVIFFLSLCLVIALCNHSKNLPSNHTIAAKYGYPKEIIGTWEGSWEYNGDFFYEILEISDDGYYSSIMYQNGVFYNEEYNIWYMSNLHDMHCMIDKERGHSILLRFENGILYNGDDSKGAMFIKKT